MDVVTTLLTGALVAITGIYAWITWQIAKKAGDAAEASKLSANAAQAAAESAALSAQIAEAALVVEFEVKIDRHRDGEVWFTVTATAGNVYVHSILLRAYVYARDAALDFVPAAEAFLGPPSVATYAMPTFMHVKEAVSFEWQRPALRTSDYGCRAHLNIEYSLALGSDRRVRTVYVESPDGLGARELAAMQLPAAKSDEAPRPT